MMKRMAFLVGTLLLLVVLGVVVVAEIPARPGVPGDVQARLSRYLVSGDMSGGADVKQIERARRPWNFTEEMSARAYGDSVHFQTDVGSSRTEPENLAPLPFPPRELWCALLARDGVDIGPRAYDVVFVGVHLDMYNADLIVHESKGDLSQPDFQEMLSALGCDLDLE